MKVGLLLSLLVLKCFVVDEYCITRADSYLKSSLIGIYTGCMHAKCFRKFTVNAVRCRLCQRATSREDCQGFAECADDEDCFLDEIITDLAETVYVGGCRAKNVCSVPSGAIGKRSRVNREPGDFVACSHCCSGNYCNEKLCGLPIDTSLLHCYACGDRSGVNPVPPVRYPEDCAHEKVCQHNEMCFASTQMFNGVKLEHTTKCMEKSICHKLMNATFAIVDSKTKRYTTPICAVCCGDDYCNSFACETVKRRLINLRADGFLDYEDLKENLWPIIG